MGWAGTALEARVVAKSAGNPVSQFERKTPIEELVAEGFGTLTTQAESVTTGRGVHADGAWHVVFTRPLRTADGNDYQFAGPGAFALSVWDGGQGNVGGRKHWSTWSEFEVQP